VRAALLVVLGLVLAGAASAATPRPDAHDRALAAQLAAKVAALRAISQKTSEDPLESAALKRCPAMKKDPAQAFAAVFALVPVLLIDTVNQYRPQLSSLRDSLARMDPDAPVFARYLALVRESLGIILRFDNHGKKIDYCQALTVLLDKKATPAQVEAVLGVDPSRLSSLSGGRARAVSKSLEKLEPAMRAFFVAAGLPPKTAATLASSG
jgi:hypothetical protein